MGILPGWHWKAPKHAKQPVNLEDLDGNIGEELRRKVLEQGHEDGVGEVDYKD